MQVQEKGIQQSTLDYVMCSPSLATNISSLVIDTDQMDSDHRPLFLTLNGLTVEKPVRTSTREVWDISNIPCPPDDWSWVMACREQFGKWIGAI